MCATSWRSLTPGENLMIKNKFKANPNIGGLWYVPINLHVESFSNWMETIIQLFGYDDVIPKLATPCNHSQCPQAYVIDGIITNGASESDVVPSQPPSNAPSTPILLPLSHCNNSRLTTAQVNSMRVCVCVRRGGGGGGGERYIVV